MISGDLMLAVLLFMLVMYALTVVYGLSFAIVYALKKLRLHAVRTIAYVLLLGMANLLAAAPFLKMHGSYSDMGRLGIVLLCVVNILLMIGFAFTRVKVLVKAGNQTAPGGHE